MLFVRSTTGIGLLGHFSWTNVRFLRELYSGNGPATTVVEVNRGRLEVPTGVTDRLARKYRDSAFASSKSFCNFNTLCSSVNPGNRISSRSRSLAKRPYWVESGYMLSGGHPSLASCIPPSEEVLSGPSDSKRIRLCGASHSILSSFSPRFGAWYQI